MTANSLSALDSLPHPTPPETHPAMQSGACGLQASCAGGCGDEESGGEGALEPTRAASSLGPWCLPTACSPAWFPRSND